MTFPMIARKGRVLQWSAAFVLLWAAPAHAADYSDHVVSILDGATIEDLHNHHPERIRLSGIDCPEEGHKGELTVALEMDSPITEEPRSFGFPIHCAPFLRLRGLNPVGTV